jgi:PPM family protein phosphatase
MDLSRPAFEVECAGLSHPGKVRNNNEDHYFAARFERTMRTLLTNLGTGQVPDSYTEAGYAMLVADGIGGEAAGEIASGTAVQLLVQLALETPDWIMSFDRDRSQEVLSRMEERFRTIAKAFVERGRAEPALAGMGTTMTLAGSVGADAIVAHVGDSRAYLFRDGRLQQLTRDQTVAQTLADAGAIAPEEVETHPSRHVLIGAITTHEGKVPVELRHLRLEDGDQLLLCSDGLTDMAADDAIGRVLARGGSADEACRGLVDLALDGGGKDNVTVVVARYRMK